ncbi:MAG TPA: hypothetical protein VJS68_02830, partial [Thermoplasmata archaeon]|nr:hypothetical protein [Thermoplasmata archaeon]
RLADRVRTLRYGTDRMKWKSWTRWWKEVVRLPQLRSEVAARKLRFPHAHHPHHRSVSVDRHARSLRRAGFRDIGVVWQVYENRVLFARR